MTHLGGYSQRPATDDEFHDPRDLRAQAVSRCGWLVAAYGAALFALWLAAFIGAGRYEVARRDDCPAPPASWSTAVARNGGAASDCTVVTLVRAGAIDVSARRR